MATIIALSGPGNSGKTTSIRRALNLVETMYPAVNRIEVIRDGVEIIIAVEINGVIIILASSGDTEKILRDLFDAIADIDWDILVCATKCYGSTVKFIEGKGSQHHLVWVEKTKQLEEAEQERAILATAEQIVRQINEAMSEGRQARRRA